MALATVAVLAGLPGDAAAACFAPRGAASARQIEQQALIPILVGAAPVLAAAQASQGGGPIVGMWRSVYTLDDTDVIYEEGFQQFHADGTELMISSGVPPSMGNVCMGVWERGAGGAISLRHVTWNWNGDEVFGDPPTGYFLLEVTLRVNDQGDGFSGTWRAASYDVDATPADPPQPGSEARGIVRSRRISVR